MAPNPLIEGLPVKRSSSDADLEAPLAIKQLKHYRHDHSLFHRQKLDQHSTDVIQDEEVVGKQLKRAIALVLQAVGFDYAEAEALESFQVEVEAYLIHFLGSVRRSMLGARRVQPVPHDFLSALNAHHLTLRSLLVHLDPPITATTSQPPLHVESSQTHTDPNQDQLISALLQETSLRPQSYVPPNFPLFPSRHTFKAEPVFNQRENDPKKVRERATEDSRMGEEALRRLISKSARRDDGPLSGSSSNTLLTLRQRARAMWRETMELAYKNKITPESSMDGINSTAASQLHQFGPPINADSAYWRKPLTRKPDRKAADG